MKWILQNEKLLCSASRDVQNTLCNIVSRKMTIGASQSRTVQQGLLFRAAGILPRQTTAPLYLDPEGGDVSVQWISEFLVVPAMALLFHKVRLCVGKSMFLKVSVRAVSTVFARRHAEEVGRTVKMDGLPPSHN